MFSLIPLIRRGFSASITLVFVPYCPDKIFLLFTSGVLLSLNFTSLSLYLPRELHSSDSVHIVLALCLPPELYGIAFLKVSFSLFCVRLFPLFSLNRRVFLLLHIVRLFLSFHCRIFHCLHKFHIYYHLPFRFLFSFPFSFLSTGKFIC